LKYQKELTHQWQPGNVHVDLAKKDDVNRKNVKNVAKKGSL